MPVTFGELVEKLLETDVDPGHKNCFIAAGNQDFLVEAAPMPSSRPEASTVPCAADPGDLATGHPSSTACQAADDQVRLCSLRPGRSPIRRSEV